MKYILLLVVISLFVSNEAADAPFSKKSLGAGFTLASTLGVNIPPECKKIIEEKIDEVVKRVYNGWMLPTCEKAKCKPTYEEGVKYVAHVKKTTQGIIADLKNHPPGDPKFDFDNIGKEKGCKSVAKIANWKKIWEEAKIMAKKCVTTPGSPGDKELKQVKDFCKVTEKDLKETGACFKKEGTALMMGKYMGELPAAIPCAEHLLQTYCNNKYLGEWLDHATKKALEDRKIYGPWNPYNCFEDYMGPLNCKAKPLVQNGPNDL